MEKAQTVVVAKPAMQSKLTDSFVLENMNLLNGLAVDPSQASNATPQTAKRLTNLPKLCTKCQAPWLSGSINLPVIQESQPEYINEEDEDKEEKKEAFEPQANKWQCRFCGTQNDIPSGTQPHLNALDATQPDMQFIYSQEPNQSNYDDSELYIYCIDCSESMNMQQYTPKAIQRYLPGDYEMQITNQLKPESINYLKQFLGIKDQRVLYYNLKYFRSLQQDFAGGDVEQFKQILNQTAEIGDLKTVSGISRLRIVTDTIVDFLSNLKIQSKKAKVFIILFHREVQLLGDCTSNDVRRITGDNLLEDHVRVMDEGSRLSQGISNKYLTDSFDSIKRKLEEVETSGGGTCMGSAIAAALGVCRVLRAKPTQITVFTDGRSNVGYAQTEVKESLTETQKFEISRKLEKDFEILGTQAQDLGCTVNLFTFSDEQCSKHLVSFLTRPTSGKNFSIKIDHEGELHQKDKDREQLITAENIKQFKEDVTSLRVEEIKATDASMTLYADRRLKLSVQSVFVVGRHNITVSQDMSQISIKLGNVQQKRTIDINMTSQPQDRLIEGERLPLLLCVQASRNDAQKSRFVYYQLLQLKVIPRSSIDANNIDAIAIKRTMPVGVQPDEDLEYVTQTNQFLSDIVQKQTGSISENQLKELADAQKQAQERVDFFQKSLSRKKGEQQDSDEDEDMRSQRTDEFFTKQNNQ